ncbi:MAG TPA: GNAT family N-acetyltransferase [Pseudonocardiaceae bacterium]|nr:GNAT family N-acetyltransferase [Pseudonocardiaceae bacterium]
MVGGGTAVVLQRQSGRWKALDVGPSGNVEVTVREDPGPEALRAWDLLVDRTPGTDVTQLSTWAGLRARVGFRPLYLLAYRGSELVGGAQILTRRMPVLGAVFALGYLPYGPLVAPDVAAADDVRRVLVDALVGLGRRRLQILFVQPPEGDHDTSSELLQHGFRPSSAGIAPGGSIRIDLTADLAEIRSRFGKRLKSWTNRWESRGVTVRAGDERDVPLLAELMATSAQHQGYTPLTLDYMTALYRELAATGHAVLFVGEVNGVPVAADLMTGCGEMVRGRLSGFDRSGEAMRLSVPAAIRWEMIKWAKAQGYRWFDFGGLRPETLDALLDGHDRSTDTLPAADQPKVTFGGTAFRYPTPVEMIRPAALRTAYDLAWRSAAGRRLFSEVQSLLRRGARMRSIGMSPR